MKRKERKTKGVHEEKGENNSQKNETFHACKLRRL